MKAQMRGANGGPMKKVIAEGFGKPTEATVRFNEKSAAECFRGFNVACSRRCDLVAGETVAVAELA